MTEPERCPSAESYQQLVSGRLCATERDTLLNHLETCPECWSRIDTILQAEKVPQVEPQTTLPYGLVESLLEIGTEALNDEDAPFQGGQPFGPYIVRSLLGRGGMGWVYLADEPALQRPVALKVMRAGLARQAKARERFLNEARAAARIRSDHVVTIHQTGEIGGQAYLAMEWLRGESLAQRLKHGPIAIDDALRWGIAIAQGLAGRRRERYTLNFAPQSQLQLDDNTLVCYSCSEPATILKDTSRHGFHVISSNLHWVSRKA